MLSFIVSETARGVDLAERYPAFYRRLQEEPELRERFQDSLDLLWRTQTNTLEPLPAHRTAICAFYRRGRGQNAHLSLPKGVAGG